MHLHVGDGMTKFHIKSSCTCDFLRYRLRLQTIMLLEIKLKYVQFFPSFPFSLCIFNFASKCEISTFTFWLVS